jgi:tetratricopeptide (TPR) repeat protein
MSATAQKARAQRLARLQSTLDGRLEHLQAALETLMAELQIGESQPQLWESLHAAAARERRELELATAYRKATTAHRLKQLQPSQRAQLLMHAADFFQGMLGDGDTAEGLLLRILEVVPGNPEAFTRLERRLEQSNERLRLAELYATVVDVPPRPPEELARSALKAISLLPSGTALSEEACQRLLGLLPANPAVLGVLEAHCRKTGRFSLACVLLERSIEGSGLSRATLVERRRRLIELYLGDAKTPEQAILHVEQLLWLDPSDARARAAAERLLSNRAVGSRAAAALQESRRRRRAGE